MDIRKAYGYPLILYEFKWLSGTKQKPTFQKGGGGKKKTKKNERTKERRNKSVVATLKFSTSLGLLFSVAQCPVHRHVIACFFKGGRLFCS